MKQKQKSNVKVIVVLILFFVFILGFYFLFGKKVKHSRNIETSLYFESLPSDVLLKDYDSYKNFIKKNLSEEEYIVEITNENITHEAFNKYDYLAIFYQTRLCNNENYLTSITSLKDKVILYTKNTNKSYCNLTTRILFVPVENNKYDNVPNVIIKREKIIGNFL